MLANDPAPYLESNLLCSIEQVSIDFKCLWLFSLFINVFGVGRKKNKYRYISCFNWPELISQNVECDWIIVCDLLRSFYIEIDTWICSVKFQCHTSASFPVEYQIVQFGPMLNSINVMHNLWPCVLFRYVGRNNVTAFFFSCCYGFFVVRLLFSVNVIHT